MQTIIEQLISQIEEDQNFSSNTKAAYRGDLKDLLDYINSVNTQLTDINQAWVKNYLKHLEETNKERNSFNRRASTFRMFLKFLYKHNLAPTNYSLIVDNQTTMLKTQEDGLEKDDIKKIVEETSLKTEQRLILLMIGKLGLSATQITSINTHQIDFENKRIHLSDTEKIDLPFEIFTILQDYLLDTRLNSAGTSEHLNLFLNEKGEPITETDIYKLIKKLSSELSLGGKLTTRSLKKFSEEKVDILSMQRDILNVIAPGQ